MSSFNPIQTTRNSTTAIISLIAGIAGFTVLPGIGSIVAVITGHIAKKEIRTGGGAISGGGMATWGLILGYIGVAIGLCLCLLWVLTMVGALSIPFLGSSSY